MEEYKAWKKEETIICPIHELYKQDISRRTIAMAATKINKLRRKSRNGYESILENEGKV